MEESRPDAPPPTDPTAPSPSGLPADADKTYATLLQLSQFLGWVIGPLAIIVTLALWLTKKQESAFIDDHGKEAMNFTISIWIYTIIAGLLTFVVIGCFILPAIMIFEIVVIILAAIKASQGEYYRYPLSIRMIS